jgi:two-component system response regulator CpxR
MKSILIIDDDIELCLMLRDYLANHDILLHMRHDGETGLSAARTNTYEMVLLDIMMPGMTGLEVLSQIKSLMPLRVLLLSALGDDAARIAGLDEGADDYLPKPFNPRELAARIRAILRRSDRMLNQVDSSAVASQAIELDPLTREAFCQGSRLHLTDVEFSLLSIFMESPGTILQREDLVSRVFQRPFNPLDRSLDMHISRLRRKLSCLNEGGDPIRTIRSSGYLFASPSQSH